MNTIARVADSVSRSFIRDLSLIACSSLVFCPFLPVLDHVQQLTPIPDVNKESVVPAPSTTLSTPDLADKELLACLLVGHLHCSRFPAGYAVLVESA